ncbi:MAG: Stp1/IreP family PP2C-type Ser/Thr phosphatase [Thermoleophilia bacterium]|nr:Stp1/IreP family PP2C-type Ser/Thr phosphatase [Thermoleophilia bacterium]
MSEHAPIAAGTDVGQRRDHNEDAHVASFPLVAVADGVGGSAKGEVASQLALDTLRTRVDRIAHAPSADEAVREMEAAVVLANRAVHDAQLTDDSLRGMATTLVAAVVRGGGELVVGHVGDSRLYVLSAAGARQVTEDHSIVAELVRTGRIEAADAPHHPQRNVITRALGPEPDVSVDAFVLHVGPGDWVLLCSDGLTEHVGDGELARAVLDAGPDHPQEAVTRLIEQANLRGGSDNITVVLVQPVRSDVSGELSVVHLAPETTTNMAAITDETAPVTSSAPAQASGPIPIVDATVSDELPDLAPLPIEPQHEEPISDEEWRARNRPAPGRRAFLTTLATLVVVVLVVGFMWSRSYFVTERTNGFVGIDRGFPVLGLSKPVRTSTVRADELSGADRERLVESRDLRDKADAERVVDQLPERVDAAGLASGASEGDAGADASSS